MNFSAKISLPAHGKGAGCVGNLPHHRCSQYNIGYYIEKENRMQAKNIGLLLFSIFYIEITENSLKLREFFQTYRTPIR
jgi:hypothetical protein